MDRKKIKFNYSGGIISIPEEVTNHLDGAGEKELRFLVALAAAQGDVSRVKKCTGLSNGDIDSAIVFWNEAGIIEGGISAGEGKSSSATVGKGKSYDKDKNGEVDDNKVSTSTANLTPPERSDELPNYTSKELAALLEERASIKALIDECQRILGKIFNTHEVNIIVGLSDYLDVDEDYILILVSHCARCGKKSLHYVEKVAFSCYDEGYTEADVLEQVLLAREKRLSDEGKIREIFGIGKRKLSSKESKMIERWFSEFSYDIEFVEKAYDLTISSINKPSLFYTGAILERWHSEGVKTLEDVEANIASHESVPEDGSSFSNNEFFEAALKRSMGMASENAKTEKSEANFNNED